jgi:predicted nucleic acid-binding protein
VAAMAIFDTCSLANFAVVDRLDLLDVRYGHRACWTSTIQSEIMRGLRKVPKLQAVLDAKWLGDPIDVAPDIAGMQAIFLNRRALSKVPSRMAATEHLGEAEIIHLMEDRHSDWVFITDDQPAKDLAKRRGLQALDSADVLAECFAMREVGCPEAFNLLERMADENRGVRIPANHTLVCPS